MIETKIWSLQPNAYPNTFEKAKILRVTAALPNYQHVLSHYNQEAVIPLLTQFKVPGVLFLATKTPKQELT